jgi:hypothetical protein
LSPEYVGKIQTGAVAFLDAPGDTQREAYSKTMLASSLQRHQARQHGSPPGRPIEAGRRSPIERHLYRQGEPHLRPGAGRHEEEQQRHASLTLFSEHHAESSQASSKFALLDNYTSIPTSAPRPDWSTAAIANDYVQKMWPTCRAPPRRLRLRGQERLPRRAGYLWTNAAAPDLHAQLRVFVNNIGPPPAGGVQISGFAIRSSSRVTRPHYGASI